MNYSQLVAEIESYTENQFQTTDIDTFIQQAEQRIYNSVQFPSIRKNVTGTTYQDNKYLSAPSDFLAVYSLAVIDDEDNYSYLLNKDVNFIRSAYPSATDTGKPEYYALFGPTTTNAPSPVITNELSFILGPTPDQAYSVELHYYYYPESIVTAGTSWLGDNFDSALLYGSLLEAYTYMKGEADVLAQYQKRYDDAMALGKRLGDGMERGDAYRDGQAKYPVK
jgi:hypothetical protein